jgi:hypothetical protein
VVVLAAERVVTLIRFSRILGVSWADVPLALDIGKLALAAGGAALATTFLRVHLLAHKPFFVLAVCGTVFGVIYIVTVLLLRIPSQDELDRVARIVPSSLRPLLRFGSTSAS